MKEALFYSRKNDRDVSCSLCPHHCLIRPGKSGLCRVRKNESGTLYSLVYGRSIAENVDPIEKKPLSHFLPGSHSFSIATVGCNLFCRHCQNADISQPSRDLDLMPGHNLPPEEVVRRALATGCRSISYTYTEPTIFFEYAYDTAVLARESGLKNVFVTNGYISPEPLREIAPYLDAANVDLKSFSREFYRKICGAKLAPVLEALKLYRELGIWLEVTTLLIPQENDSDAEVRQIAEFISKELGPDVPWHVSSFHPTHRLTDRPRTPLETLRRARKIGLSAGLQYVYQGNIPGEGEDTLCPGCRKSVISRIGFTLRSNHLQAGRCPHCLTPVEGVW